MYLVVPVTVHLGRYVTHRFRSTTSDVWHIAYVSTRPRLHPLVDDSLITDLLLLVRRSREVRRMDVSALATHRVTKVMMKSSLR